MARIVTRSELQVFLERVRDTASYSNRFSLVPRKDNLNALAEYGFERTVPRTIARSLTRRDYAFTDADRDRPGDVWVFGRQINKISLYIKLKLEIIGGRDFVKCLSFHPEREGSSRLRFPYRES